LTDALGRITSYAYTTHGLLQTMTRAVGTSDQTTMSFEYDASDNLTAVIDGLGRRTQYAYDNLHRLTSLTQADPDGTGVDGGRKRRRGDRVAAVQNGGAQPCRSLGGEDRGDSPDHTPFQREAQECTATWRSGARYAVRC
jgi:YD repeat-containing protein